MLKSKHYDVCMYVHVYEMRSVQRVKSVFMFVPYVHTLCICTRTCRACVSVYGTNMCQCCEINKSENQIQLGCSTFCTELKLCEETWFDIHSRYQWNMTMWMYGQRSNNASGPCSVVHGRQLLDAEAILNALQIALFILVYCKITPWLLWCIQDSACPKEAKHSPLWPRGQGFSHCWVRLLWCLPQPWQPW